MSLDVRTDAYLLAHTAEETAESNSKIRAFVMSVAIALGISVSCVIAVLLHVN
jgi:hypothetical protein